ncbi:MAG: class II aldolase/adducin family protein [Chloroherpetonaceae bacterium]|nr:class II aldolase/adducin family protein [Chloroherpetonaceae bacterium]
MQKQLQESLSHFSRLCAEKNFVAAYDGNLSIRSAEGIYITSTRTLKSNATAQDICLVSPDGRFIEGLRPASTETAMHLLIYAMRPDVNAIVHAHPPATTAFAVARLSLEAALFPEVILDIGPVPLAAYATPSTEEVPNSLKPFVGSANAILLANHGLVTYAENLQDAFYRMDKLEHAAKTVLYAKIIGGSVPLSKKEIDYLYETHPVYRKEGKLLDCETAIEQSSSFDSDCACKNTSYLNPLECQLIAQEVRKKLSL